MMIGVAMLLCFCQGCGRQLCGQRLYRLCGQRLEIFLLSFQRFLPASLRRVRPSWSTKPTEGAMRADAAIAALPMRTIGAEAQPANNVSCCEAGTALDALDECSICLSAFQAGQTLTTLPCKHSFHSDCIRRWCATVKLEDDLTCPLCKQSIRPPDQSAATPPATPSASERSVANSTLEIEMVSAIQPAHLAMHVTMSHESLSMHDD